MVKPALQLMCFIIEAMCHPLIISLKLPNSNLYILSHGLTTSEVEGRKTIQSRTTC
jgi:hypothetical protein